MITGQAYIIARDGMGWLNGMVGDAHLRGALRALDEAGYLAPEALNFGRAFRIETGDGLVFALEGVYPADPRIETFLAVPYQSSPAGAM